jgi:hypothetical protein
MALLSEARCRRTAIVNNDATLSSKIKSVQETLQEYLKASKPKPTRGRWPTWLVPYDPVRTKNLQKINGYLVRMLHFKLDLSPNASDSNARIQPLTSLLQQIEKPATLSSDAIWEVADALEMELVELGDDTYVYTLLKEQQRSDNEWERYFPRDDLDDLLKTYSNGTFQVHEGSKARSFLVRLLLARVDEYRRDRAKAQLRGKYLVSMALFLAVFVAGFTIFFIVAVRQADLHQPVDPLFVLLLVLFAGAAGSILSRAIKLGKQPLHAEPDTKHDEIPLGIRALIADRKTFLAQPVIGATTALILFLVFQAGLIQIGGGKELSPAAYGLVGFLGGFSEPFVLGILDKVAGQWGSTLS